MPAYHPAAELAPRDIVSRAIFEEMKKGKVYLDFTRADAKFLASRFPLIWGEVKKAGFNLAQDLIPIFPVAHYACGGVVANLRGETSVRNLFAVGEVADTGIHGANRLASNSLAEAVVFGLAVGKAGKVITTKVKLVRLPSYQFDAEEDKRILPLVRKTMWEKVGIVRDKKGLTAAIKILRKLQPKSFLSKNAVTVAELVTTAALKRQKSLGAHFRLN
jgi:L-aspartate oxidase